MSAWFIAHKPCGVLSKFTDAAGRPTLRALGCAFPPDVYPVGRLDMDSEGLLLLTNDRAATDRLLNPRHGHEREYWVQVERVPDAAAIRRLERGEVVLDGRATLPARARPIAAPDLPPRDPPIRARKTVPTAWLSIVLREGRNRQVRRMTAAVGHPTLRLVRVRIENLRLEGIGPGEVRALRDDEVRELRRRLGCA